MLAILEDPWLRHLAPFHIVVNNQIGFTTSDPRDTVPRSTAPISCQDGRGADLPRQWRRPRKRWPLSPLAVDFRQEFKRDVVIDMICFRKLGHNEQDEPMVTSR